MYVARSPARVSKGDLLMVRQAHHERMLGYARSLLFILIDIRDSLRAIESEKKN
jgi:hypothetical protein